MTINKTNYLYEIPVNSNYSREIHRCRFRLSDFKNDERMTIFGLTGTGKSYLSKKILQYQARKRLVVVLDTKKEKMYKKIPELTMEKILDRKSKGLYKLNEIEFPYEGKIVKTDNPYVICEFLAANLFKRKNCLFLVEELADVVPKTSKPLTQIMPHLGRYVTQGRDSNCGFIGTSQRPAQTHTSIPSQSNHIISFFMSLEHDVKYLKRWFPEIIYQKFSKRDNDKISHEFVRFYVNTQTTFHHYRYYPRSQKEKERLEGDKVSRNPGPDKN